MPHLKQTAAVLAPERLLGIRRGIEKESLRVLPNGHLASTRHPSALGSPLTHPCITTDFSEAQIELVTGVHADVSSCLAELTELHQAAHAALTAGGELLWAASMPCPLPEEQAIPIGHYGTSNAARVKHVYRIGLSHRYGRRMQTISGIHYNWSLPGISSDEYFGLIRNFRRLAFVPLYLCGASPAVCASFLADRPHDLQPLGNRADQADTLYAPWATSLRMGRLGYQSDAQAALNVSYNTLHSYAASLQTALTQSYPPYEAMGIQNPDGSYNQLATTLLQIENEFYGVIRPKRVCAPDERPLHALRERGVEYVEVRLVDLDPFTPIGISADTARFFDLFLLHCLLTESPPDSPEEIAEMKQNQQRTAARGREPGLLLQRGGQPIALSAWLHEILLALPPLAEAMDAASGRAPGAPPGASTAYRDTLARMTALAGTPAQLPAARVLHAITTQHADSFAAFALTQSGAAHTAISALPYPDALRQHFAQLARKSAAEQARIEAQDTLPFEAYRREYLSPARLEPGHPIRTLPGSVA